MNIAVTIWEDRVSPVFDASRMLLVAEIRDYAIVKRHAETFDPADPVRLANRLQELDVTVFICGAITQRPANVMESSGIRLIPFVGGKAEEVLASWAHSGRIHQDHFLPGCGVAGAGKKQRRQKRQHRNGGRPNKEAKQCRD